MEEQQLQLLIQKYLLGTATTEERKLLEEWHRTNQQDDMYWELGEEDVETVKKRIQNNIWDRISIQQKPYWYKRWTTYAAAASIVLIATFSTFLIVQKSSNVLVAKTQSSQIENRHVTLPDSTVVILRPGSELLVSAAFGENTREVELIGEAYFDVRANAQKPFIIITGKIKTTVLGTAFSIKATPNEDQIEVLVSHGRVRVENDKGILGILTADQKMVAKGEDFERKEIMEVKATSHQELAWKEEDMHFESLAFGELAKKLERRYDVHISFKNIELKSCKMSGVFLGTENLEDVLTNLCLTSNASFKKVGDNLFEIEGAKCFN